MLLPLVPILLACLIGVQAPSQPPPVDSKAVAVSTPTVLPLARGLVSRYVKAVGGRVALWDLESFTAHATLSFTGGKAKGQLDLAFRRPDLMRIRLDLANLGSSEVGADGQSAWEIVHTANGETAEIIPMQDAQRRRRELNWFELALRLTEGARTFRTIAPAEFEHYPCWEIQKITRAGIEERLFIDRESFLLRGIRMIETGPQGEYEVTMSFRDWKPVKPLVLFHELVVSRENMQLIVQFDQISLDTVSPATFRPPPSVRELLQAVPAGAVNDAPKEDETGDSPP